MYLIHLIQYDELFDIVLLFNLTAALHDNMFNRMRSTDHTAVYLVRH